MGAGQPRRVGCILRRLQPGCKDRIGFDRFAVFGRYFDNCGHRFASLFQEQTAFFFENQAVRRIVHAVLIYGSDDVKAGLAGRGQKEPALFAGSDFFEGGRPPDGGFQIFLSFRQNPDVGFLDFAGEDNGWAASGGGGVLLGACRLLAFTARQPQT